MKKSAFTLVELLVVMAVIAILVGIVMPLIAGMPERARDSKAAELCGQVADAWTYLVILEKRTPDTKLLDSVVDCKACGEDVCFKMTPAAGLLLNRWSSNRAPIPAVDKAQYEKNIAENKHWKKYNVSKAEFPTYAKVLASPHFESRLERSVPQKRWGVFAPWVERELRELVGDDASIDETEDENIDKHFLEGGDLSDGVVTVALDTNGDGLLTIPKEMVNAAEDVELKATAAAWVWNKNHDKVLHSW